MEFNTIHIYLNERDNTDLDFITFETKPKDKVFPDAILKIKHGESIHHHFMVNAPNIDALNGTSLTRTPNGIIYYLYNIKDNKEATLEDLCRALVDESKGESYDCHSPDLVLSEFHK